MSETDMVGDGIDDFDALWLDHEAGRFHSLGEILDRRERRRDELG